MNECSKGWTVRCANSKGTHCTCRCGGENHGKARSQNTNGKTEQELANELPAELHETLLDIGEIILPTLEQHNIYRGEIAEYGRYAFKACQGRVTVNGRTLDTCTHIRNHSPDGFAWGYGGSGPAQLALAILVNEIGVRNAERYYQQFKWACIATLPQDKPWVITSADIRKALDKIRISEEVTT